MKLNTFSAAVLGALIALGATQSGAAGYNYVVNGGFEDDSSATVGLVNGHAQASLTGTGTGSWDVYSSLPGWTAGSTGGGIEVQTELTVNLTPHSGNYYVELDSEKSGGFSNSSMSQELVLSEGRYELSFWYSPRKSDEATNGISYEVKNAANNSLLLGEVTGPNATNGTATGTWTFFNAIFNVAAGDLPISLIFAATGKEDTYGGFIDDISVSAVPVPAALPLLITGLAGLGFMSRRKRAA